VSLAVFVLFCPFSIAFFQHSRCYVMGSSIYVNGNTPITYPEASIDRQTRIRTRGPGCGFSHSNEVSNWAQELAGSLMYHLMGPPPGAYTGPYPTQVEAESALASSGVRIVFDPTFDDTVVLPSAKVTLPGSLHCQYQQQPGSVPPEMLVPTAAIWKQRCLILRVPRDLDPKPYGPYEDIYLIDIQTSQMFAMYSRPK
jgi:hypothetical protein